MNQKILRIEICTKLKFLETSDNQNRGKAEIKQNKPQPMKF